MQHCNIGQSWVILWTSFETVNHYESSNNSPLAHKTNTKTGARIYFEVAATFNLPIQSFKTFSDSH